MEPIKIDQVVIGSYTNGRMEDMRSAPLCLKEAGVSCVIAETFARIFFRNAISIGLPIIECPEAAAGIEVGGLVNYINSKKKG